jgi:hypothetical protein
MDAICEHVQNRKSASGEQPLNRRRALHVLGALAAAAAGAAAVGSDNAAADNPGSFTSSTGFPAVEGANSGIGIGAYGIAPLYIGVVGGSTSGVGVYGATDGLSVPPLTTFTSNGVWGQANGGGSGVRGDNLNNTSGGIGVLGNATGGSFGAIGVSGVSSGQGGTGVSGVCDTGGQASGVYGSSSSGYGVVGYGAAAGVYGVSQTQGGPGVHGSNQNGGTGVIGESNSAIGVWGVTTTWGQGLANPAVAGTNNGGGAGLVGFTAGPSSIGLAGATTSGIGAYGSSQTGIGLFGYSNTGFAINGNSPGGGYAGYFSGPVFVTGSLTAMGAKSAAVRSKGELRRVYSLESPESWFEDFGNGQLTGGQATVSLEPGFAGIVHTDTYHVFLTAYGDSQGLYVSERHNSGFTVREQQGGKSNIAFDYRVVAKRADIEGTRLEHIDQPQPIDGPKEPVLDHAPKPPELPAMPTLPMSRPGG